MKLDQLTAFKIKNFLVPVNWFLWHQCRWSSYSWQLQDWWKLIRTVECGILAMKKTSVKTLQIGIYSIFINVPIKHVQDKNMQKKKKSDSKRKTTFFYLNFPSIATLKKNDFQCRLCLLSICLFWLTPCIFDFLYLWI